jgi:hypothetical protein
MGRAQPPTASTSSWNFSTAFSNALSSMETAVTAVSVKLKVKAEELDHGVRDNLEGAYCVYAAGIQAESYAPDAILEETGCQLKALISGILPGLLQMLEIVGATTVLGAGIGGAVGLFAGGAGAIPGLAIGGELGFDVGMAALTWMGLGFLAVAIAEGFVDLYNALHTGVEWAWQAKGLKAAAQKEQLDRAAHKLAEAAGILMRLVLQAIVAELLRRAAMGSTRAAMARGNALGTAAAEGTDAAFLAQLRASKFGNGFADWVERNKGDLTKNPKLQPKATTTTPQKAPTQPEGESGGTSSDAPKPAKKPAGSDAPEEPEAEPAPPKPSGFDALKKRRQAMGLPPAGAEGDSATLAELDVGGQKFDGINRGLQDPKTPMTLQRVNAQTITHAEAEAVQNAVNAGAKGTTDTAEMWVDRDPCGSCGKSGGLRSLARELGVKQLIVHSPSGTEVYTPTQ